MHVSSDSNTATLLKYRDTAQLYCTPSIQPNIDMHYQIPQAIAMNT